NRPTTGVGREDLTRVPVELGAVEHLVGPAALLVADQNDRQQAVAARLVVEGLDRLDGQSGMEAELVEFEFGPGLLGVLGPRGHAGKATSSPAGPPPGLGVRFGPRCRFVERSLGMDVADEVNVFGQVAEHALAA